MKKILLLLMTCVLLNSSVSFAREFPMPKTQHGIEISIGSIGHKGVDVAAYKKVRHLIGNAVANGVVDKFIVLGYGQQGGFSACIEDKISNQPMGKFFESSNKAFEKFVWQLRNVKPNPKTTSYNINWVASCSDTVTKPETVRVAKSDEGKQCENNGISLTEMQKQLVGVTVYSSSKENDGRMRITLCGIDAGTFNVYEIAASDLSSAIAFGFREWIDSEVRP
jgi:hypothetical protein